MFEKRGQPKQHAGFFARNRIYIGIATLVGTIVGAGILGIPYVVAKAGLLYGILLIILLGVCFLFLHLFCGEVVLRTKGQHQLTGYAEKYLGKNGKRLMTLSMIINIYGALTAYLIGEGNTFYNITNIGTPLIFSLIFFLLTFFIIYKGIKATGRAELVLISLLFLVILGLGVLSIDKIEIRNFSTFHWEYFFLPYGVVIFALMGMPAIPEVQEQLGVQKDKMKKTILIGSTIPIILYIFFAIIIVGMIGLDQFEALEPNQRIATIALSIYSSSYLGLFANLLAILAMLTSYLSLGTALLEAYHYDYKFSRTAAFFLTFSIPLLIIFFNLTSFITILTITGVFAGGLEGTLVVLMYWRAKKLGDRKPEYSLPTLRMLGITLIFLFVLGLLYQLLNKFF
jgi:amino acid permease